MLYFTDSYALIEFIGGNKGYEGYFTGENDIITTKLNLLELYYFLISRYSEEKAEEYFASFLPKVVELEDEHLKDGGKFRFTHKKQNILYIDAIGYELACSMKIKFLTGDKEFEGMPNVEFINGR